MQHAQVAAVPPSQRIRKKGLKSKAKKAAVPYYRGQEHSERDWWADVLVSISAAAASGPGQTRKTGSRKGGCASFVLDV